MARQPLNPNLLREVELRRYLASPLARFEPWITPDGIAPQADLLAAFETSRKILFRAGNKVGKTLTLAWLTLLACCNWHPFLRPRKLGTAWVSALDWEWGIGDDFWPAFNMLMPWDEVRSVQWYRKQEPRVPRTITFKSGWQLVFKSAEAGRVKYQGTPIDLLVLNEEHPRDVVEEARRGLTTRGGHLLVGLTPVEGARWVQTLEQELGTVTVRARLGDACRATAACLRCPRGERDPECFDCRGTGRVAVVNAEAVEDYLASLSSNMRGVREAGDYGLLEGSVFPDFTRRTHVAKARDGGLWIGSRRLCEYPLPDSLPRFAAWDFGYGESHPTAVLRGALLTELGVLVVERCWYGSFIRTSQWARFMAPLLRGVPVFADHDADGSAELRANGIHVVPAKKRLNPGLEVVGRLLQERPASGFPSLVLVEDPSLRHPQVGRCDAEKIAWEFERYRYPAYVDGKLPSHNDAPIKKDDHAMDALRYLAVGTLLWSRARQRAIVSDFDGLLGRVEGLKVLRPSG